MSMKRVEPTKTTILIIGHRRPWKKQFQLTGRHWPLAMGVSAVLVSLLLMVGTYQVWQRWVMVANPVNSQPNYQALARQVAEISANTQAGLGALNTELHVLTGDAAHLSALSNRVAHIAGLTPVTLGARMPAYGAVKTPTRSVAVTLMASLHQLATRLRLRAHRTVRRTT